MPTEPTSSIVRLACSPNNFPWGKTGKSSLVAQFAPNACEPNFTIKESETYSELWMGSHPTNPASIYPSGPVLSEHIAAHPEALGDASKFPAPFTGKGTTEGEGGHVPFLFKILCCKQALPMQIHPNKKVAEDLHSKDPEQFPDTNHKPEIAVCLSDRFLGFAHFRPLSEITSLFRAIPELESVSSYLQVKLRAFTTGGVQAGASSLKDAWVGVLAKESEKELGKVMSQVAKRVAKEGVGAWSSLDSEGEVWTEKVRSNLTEAVGILEEYNPGDPSSLAALLFMNLVELKKGEGMYVGADGLHAWLQGDIVELMALSDNVLNVGFTSRSEIDEHLPIVQESITFQSVDPSSIALSRTPFVKGLKRNTTVYSVPFEEFSILHTVGEEEMEAFTGPAIGIVTSQEAVTVGAKGEEGVRYERGSVFFVPAHTGFRTDGNGEVWMAFYDGDDKTKDQVGSQ